VAPPHGAENFTLSPPPRYVPVQEDSHTVELTLDAQSALLGVFDGHGGAECAEYCQRHAVSMHVFCRGP